MSETVSIVMPAYRAEPFIGAAVRSVLAQTYPHWRLWIVSDDGEDYDTVLLARGLADRRFRFLSSGTIGGGASRARNMALDLIDTPYAAILDADDRFKPQKLERAVAALADHAVVTSALDVMNERFGHLRHVGAGPDRVLRPAEHKFVSLSMDSMILWDRRRCDARYDTGLTNMTDLELLMQLYRTAGRSWHLGEPLHDYIKLTVSMSNGPGVTETMIRSKKTLLRRLEDGCYPMADPDGPAGIASFLRVSLEAEALYPAALAETPGLLFEDHLEPMLASATSAA
ncbi:MAG: glycosyltransferase family A protein [Devosia sp.]|nr:glycosyltransferase family A protein [Devosia sp.]